MTNLDLFSKILNLLLPESYWAEYLSKGDFAEQTQKFLPTKVGMGKLLHHSEVMDSEIFISER